MVYPDEIDMQAYFRFANKQSPKLIEAGSIEEERDEIGYTNPNLHRRIDPQTQTSPILSPNTYSFTIQNNQSYRLTHIHTHDEDSTTSEIP